MQVEKWIDAINLLMSLCFKMAAQWQHKPKITVSEHVCTLVSITTRNIDILIHKIEELEDRAERAGGRGREKKGKTSRRSGSAGGHLSERHSETPIEFHPPCYRGDPSNNTTLSTSELLQYTTPTTNWQIVHWLNWHSHSRQCSNLKQYLANAPQESAYFASKTQMF